MGKHSKARRAIVPNTRGAPVQAKKQGRLPLALWIGLAGLLVLVAGIMLVFRPAGSQAKPEVTGQPKLQVSQEVLDFGKVALNRPVKASFKVKNVGDQDLYILRTPQVEVKQGC